MGVPQIAETIGEPDERARRDGFKHICGVDEAGRGPLAGPVVAAAVVLSPNSSIPGLTDSKKLSPSTRARLVPEIRSKALGIGVGSADHAEIDSINIFQASLLAMARAVKALPFEPDFILVDGTHPIRRLAIPQKALVRGDSRSLAIAAASVVAKEYRDELMRKFGTTYPGYGFEVNKGYPTGSHRDALRRLGPCPIHRRSFKGVKTDLIQSDLFDELRS